MPSGSRGSRWSLGTEVAWTGSSFNISRVWWAVVERRRERGLVGTGSGEGTVPAWHKMSLSSTVRRYDSPDRPLAAFEGSSS